MYLDKLRLNFDLEATPWSRLRSSRTFPQRIDWVEEKQVAQYVRDLRYYYSLQSFSLELYIEGRRLGAGERIPRDVTDTKVLTVVPLLFVKSRHFLNQVRWSSGKTVKDYVDEIGEKYSMRPSWLGGLPLTHVLREQDFDSGPIHVA